MVRKMQAGMVGFWVLGILASAQGQSVSVLLEKGLHQEETVGDLDAAMKIYQKIVADAKADRPFIARAEYRLALCYLKKKQRDRAIAALEALIRSFGDQEQVVAKARRALAAARGRISGPELAKAVKDAVMVISTCTEGDPRVRKQLDLLKGLNSAAVAKELAGLLGAKSRTVRRAAVYVLWRGGLADISAAAPALLKLCEHEEDLTRGMAAIALGGNKVAAAYPKLCEMTLKDRSGYARRCGAYALGLLGRGEAREVLQKALKDTDGMVRNNAEAALRMLSRAAGDAPAGPKVVRSTPANFANDVPADLKTVAVVFDHKMRDRCWSWVRRSKQTYPETTGPPAYDAGRTTCSLPVRLRPGKVYWIGINHPPYTSFMAADGTQAQQHVLLFATRSADGKPTEIPKEMLAKARAILAAAGRPAPRVVATAPATLADNVPASLGKITVTFDQEMMDQSWSWVKIGDESYPEPAGKPSYDAARKTCTLPVRLQPGKVYWVQVNGDRDRFFQTAARKPAAPYAILFATRGKNGKPTEIPPAIRARAEAINAAAGQAAAGKLAARGWQLWNARKLPEAEAKFRQAVKLDPRSANAWNGLGWAIQNQGKLTEARRAFEKCLAIDPRQTGALNGLGWIAKSRNDTDKALAYWKKAVEAFPGTTAALNGLASTYMELKNYAEAVRYYEMWLKVEPGSAEAKAGLKKATDALGAPRH